MKAIFLLIVLTFAACTSIGCHASAGAGHGGAGAGVSVG